MIEISFADRVLAALATLDAGGTTSEVANLLEADPMRVGISITILHTRGYLYLGVRGAGRGATSVWRTTERGRRVGREIAEFVEAGDA